MPRKQAARLIERTIFLTRLLPLPKAHFRVRIQLQSITYTWPSLANLQARLSLLILNSPRLKPKGTLQQTRSVMLGE
jgi:hypothetical protein